MIDIEILLIASLVAVTCSFLGSFLLVRKEVLIADSISHAVLPGIAVAFLLTGQRTTLFVVVGAALAGVIAVVGIDLISRARMIKKDTSMGVIYPFFFAIGVLLVTYYASRIDLDLNCVLFGEILFTVLDRTYLPPTLAAYLGFTDIGPRALWIMLAVFTTVVTVVLLIYKEIKITSFDPSFSRVVGINPYLLYYILVTLVSLSIVAAFEIVGAILVLSFIATPPATAYLITKRSLAAVVVIGSLISLVAVVIGYWWGSFLDLPIAAAMATTSGVIFAAVLFGKKVVESLK